jgi:uncharacterized protein YbjQ (UPF0145 family)
MKPTDITIHTTDIDQPYKELGEITAKASKRTLYSKSPTLEEVHVKLQEQASKLGANAVIKVTYNRAASLFSFEVLKAIGIAVRREVRDR